MTDKPNKTLSHAIPRKALAHALSGSLGSVIAMILTYPLERLRVIKQLELKMGAADITTLYAVRFIIKTQGVLGLYDGLSSMIVALCTSNFIYFYWLTVLRTMYRYLALRSRARARNVEIGPVVDLLLASTAGLINVFITSPIWHAYMRIAADDIDILRERTAASVRNELYRPARKKKYTGIIDCLSKLYGRNGFISLWRGLGPSMILCINPSIQVSLYEFFKRVAVNWRGNTETRFESVSFPHSIIYEGTSETFQDPTKSMELNAYGHLILGGTSKLIATIVTYPLQVAQAHIRAFNDKEERTTLSCLIDIWKTDGLAGCYVGVQAKLWQTCLTSAFMFAFYERMVVMWLK